MGQTNRNDSGFTLVEMLVSVTLVLLMMSLFAQVFVSSTQILSRERGITENDQRGRMLSTIVRGDLDGRTFRDVIPFRAGSNGPVTSSPLSQRRGYFEIDEGDPDDDTDDVLQFTATINPFNKPANNKNGNKYTGLAANETTRPIASIPTASSVTVSGDFSVLLKPNAFVWISGSAGVNAGTPYSNDGRYQVNGAPTFASGTTTIVLQIPTTPSPTPATLTIPTSGSLGNILLSEFDPEFDDGVINNKQGASTNAEICYFLRNGNLYRRVLMIRDLPTGNNISFGAQPEWAISLTPISPLTSTSSSFWNEFDYSAFHAPANLASQASTSPFSTYVAPAPSFPTGAVFHDSTHSFDNSNQAASALANYVSLGLPFQRFGHSTTNGLPQDASTLATIGGASTSIVRYNLQECSNPNFGYPDNLLIDPVTPALGATNPFDRQNIVIDPKTILVKEYSDPSTYPANTAPFRRGQDILLANVLSFDVKVWDPINAQFVDIGSAIPSGPFSPNPSVVNPEVGTINAGIATTAGVLYNTDGSGNVLEVIGGRLNTIYGNDVGPLDNRKHFRFDTWHPNAAIVANSIVTGSALPIKNQPPYFDPVNPPAGTAPFTYNEPPYVPAAQLVKPATGSALVKEFPLSAIQITITYRDISSGQIRTMTVVQNLIDSVKGIATFQQPKVGGVTRTVNVPILP